jgi:hypothetical protein
MVDYMYTMMSDEELEIYAKTVTSFAAVTQCLYPTLETLPLRPHSDKKIIIKDYNIFKGTACGTTYSNPVGRVIFSLTNAIEMGMDYNAPPAYLRKLIYAAENLHQSTH